MEIKIVLGSIVDLDCDAIVNAANKELRGGSGVCGAIFKSAGWEELQKECYEKGPIKTGEAAITKGYNLKAKYIIHAVGPTDGNAQKLHDAFYNSLLLADSYNLKTIGLVPISTGIFGFPLKECALIATKLILDYKPKSLQKCIMYCFGEEEYKVFCKTLNQLLNK